MRAADRAIYTAEDCNPYDSEKNTWSIAFFRLPLPLAKLGTTLLDVETIMIAGGMSADYKPRREVFTFHLFQAEWRQKNSLSEPRLTYTGLYASQDVDRNEYVYAIGGNESRRGERFIV